MSNKSKVLLLLNNYTSQHLLSTNYLLGPNLHLTCIILFSLINTPRVRYYDNSPHFTEEETEPCKCRKKLAQGYTTWKRWSLDSNPSGVTPEPKLWNPVCYCPRACLSLWVCDIIQRTWPILWQASQVHCAGSNLLFYCPSIHLATHHSSLIVLHRRPE